MEFRTKQIVLIIAYDGTRYFGWHATKEGPSIESALKSVLEQILQEKIVLRAASRTDRGVHAEHQVVDFFTTRSLQNLERLQISLNQLLPPDIVCRKALFAPDTNFHPSTDAAYKTYRYFITPGPLQLPLHRHTHWHVHFPMDHDLLLKSRDLLIGQHDFQALANHNKEYRGENTVRTIFDIAVNQDIATNSLSITMRGDAFLYKMARNIVGTMVSCSRKKIDLQDIEKAFASGDRTLAGMTAPAHGLSLIHVAYPTPDKLLSVTL